MWLYRPAGERSLCCRDCCGSIGLLERDSLCCSDCTCRLSLVGLSPVCSYAVLFFCSWLSFGLFPFEGAVKFLPLSAPDTCDFFPPVNVDVKRVHIPLADIFEAEGHLSHLSPEASSSYKRSLGIVPSALRWTCPSQRSRRSISKVNMRGILVGVKTSVFGTRPLHLTPGMHGECVLALVLAWSRGSKTHCHTEVC